jgi:hypothetical protein
MRLSHYSDFTVFDLFGRFQMPFLGRVLSHDLRKGHPKGHLKSAQKSLKTFKTLIVR